MPNAGERGAPYIIRNPADAYQLYVNLVNSARIEIMLLLPAPTPDRDSMLRSTLRSLEEATGRGVKVRVLTPGSAKLPVNNGVAVRHIYYRESGTEVQEAEIMASLSKLTQQVNSQSGNLSFNTGLGL